MLNQALRLGFFFALLSYTSFDPLQKKQPKKIAIDCAISKFLAVAQKRCKKKVIENAIFFSAKFLCFLAFFESIKKSSKFPTFLC